MASVALLVLEIMFDHISSLKVRRRIAIGDEIFSGEFIEIEEETKKNVLPCANQFILRLSQA